MRLAPSVKNAMMESFNIYQDVATQSIDKQFEALIITPLSKIKTPSHPILIILDALDECNSLPDDVFNFVNLIDKHSRSLPSNLKVLLTSNHNSSLLRTLESKGWPILNIDSDHNTQRDLARFIHHGCQEIREHFGLRNEWPSSEDVMQLVEMSRGGFQWAQTAMIYVSLGPPVQLLQHMLQHSNVWSGLDNLYHQILSRAFESVREDATRRALLTRVLGYLATAPYPISHEVIVDLDSSVSNIVVDAAQLEDMHRALKDGIPGIASLLLIPASSAEPIQLRHPSIRSFLVRKHLGLQQSFWVSLPVFHQQLAERCLVTLQTRLQRNTCDVIDPSNTRFEIQDIAKKRISETLRYACRAWPIHLMESVQLPNYDKDGAACIQLATFASFSTEKLLAWLEVMGILGAMSEARLMVQVITSSALEKANANQSQQSGIESESFLE
ncbi:hypothetical protein FRB90_002078 [Tulasnella sp. 427]|nr:hypothetical protein FRB90_002078 [Tulasnella sp. 427]